jgi:O-antigen/teichoic acid export membrane protein
LSNSIKSNIVSGFIWTSFQTVGTKLISLVAQLLLAWLLLPEDFGKVSIALSITSIVFIIQNFGLSDVLVNRGKMFATVYNLAKTLSSVVAVLCISITIIAAFLGGYIYEDTDITNLILIFSLAIPFTTLSVVPDAKLRIDLKFKQLSIIRVTEFLISQTTIICFVLLGLGIYSFVLGPVISAIVRYIWLTKVSNCTHFFSFTLNHYMYLFGNSVYGFFHSLFQTIIRQSDYLILALFVGKTAVGIYFMAYSLSVQVIGLLVNSLSPILFPTLMKIPINEIGRIKSVLLKITVYFSMLGMPFAIWQAVIADSLIDIFFNENWNDTIFLVQILSIGIGFNVVSALWAPALRIMAKFKTQAYYSLYAVLFFISLTIPLSFFMGNKGMAYAVSIYFMISSPLLLYFSFKNYGVKFLELLKPIFKYFLLSIIIFGFNYFLTLNLEFGAILKFFINGLLSPIIYFGVLILLDKDVTLLLKEIINVRKK